MDMPVLDMGTDNTTRPPQLTSMPSTPGPDFPGGYPRNSVVFATNQWDRPTGRSGFMATARSYLPTKAKTYLPSSVTSYFPEQPSDSQNKNSSVAQDTLQVPPLNTDGSIASDFSTRAVAGSGSSRGLATPVPSDFAEHGASSSVPSTPEASGNFSNHLSDAPNSNPVSESQPMSIAAAVPATTPHDELAPTPPTYPDVVPLPSVAPFAIPFISTQKASPAKASPASPTPRESAGDHPIAPSSPKSSCDSSGTTSDSNSPSTAPSSPVFASASPKATHAPLTFSLSRFASVKRGAGPPSAFVRARRNDANSNLNNSSNTETTTSGSSSPKRSRSILRTLRGEVKVLSGRLRHDPARVEEGKRMMKGD